jgi:hypothetical protein
MDWVKGNELKTNLQRQVLSTFHHRFTGNHRPSWANDIWKDGMTYPIQFIDDADWLAHTLFAITETGTLARTIDYCISSPTWPNNPELRKVAQQAA